MVQEVNQAIDHKISQGLEEKSENRRYSNNDFEDKFRPEVKYNTLEKQINDLNESKNKAGYDVSNSGQEQKKLKSQKEYDEIMGAPEYISNIPVIGSVLYSFLGKHFAPSQMEVLKKGDVSVEEFKGSYKEARSKVRNDIAEINYKITNRSKEIDEKRDLIKKMSKTNDNLVAYIDNAYDLIDNGLPSDNEELKRIIKNHDIKQYIDRPLNDSVVRNGVVSSLIERVNELELEKDNNSDDLWDTKQDIDELITEYSNSKNERDNLRQDLGDANQVYRVLMKGVASSGITIARNGSNIGNLRDILSQGKIEIPKVQKCRKTIHDKNVGDYEKGSGDFNNGGMPDVIQDPMTIPISKKKARDNRDFEIYFEGRLEEYDKIRRSR